MNFMPRTLFANIASLHEIPRRDEMPQPASTLEPGDKIQKNDRDSEEDALEEEDEKPAPEDVEEEIAADFDLDSLSTFVLESAAIGTLKQRLNDFVNPSFRSQTTKLMERLLQGKDAENDGYWRDMKVRMLTALTEIREVGPERIEVDAGSAAGKLDRLQLWLESITGEEWGWWPLEPPKYPVGPGQERIKWRCKFGKTAEEIVPSSFAGGSKGVDVKIFPRDVIFYFALSWAQVHSREATTMDVLRRSRHIFLVAMTNEDRLRQLPSLYLSTRDFGQQLCQVYRELKGFWRFWLSPYGFSGCDFARFEKYGRNMYTYRCLEVPGVGQPDYYYVPRPILDNPPISHTEFKRLYDFGRKSKAWASGLPFHSSCTCDFSESTVASIPQRYYELNERGTDREVFWGLYIRERRSALMTSIVVFLCLSPFYAFCALYLTGYVEGDLQNALTPLTVALTLLALFFGSLIKG
ncbi:hypothetical protein Cob_v003843 [Colletotrichum orbiculare MAFF 240422]|uniref:Uncharacterized protein n=1 Tax=Colletotrichum orbiculare (strain 104-T / ATCC 96160 / CBS 514.97 / LARS 414 / MAFF 240422) TaxID=1213857 RepID=A0A484G0M1_COLOR|nr:hypothetical protein Cob_v003843 [Colletotrichum orbiculare MAFF 240422]